MPFYELRCKSCGREFEQRASIAERTEKKIPCPDCGGVEMDPVFHSGPAVHIKSHDGEACPHAAACGCGGCCHHHH